MSATPVATSLVSEVDQLLQRLGVPRTAYTGGTLAARSPITGEVLAQVPQQSATDATAAIGRARHALVARGGLKGQQVAGGGQERAAQQGHGRRWRRSCAGGMMGVGCLRTIFGLQR